MPRSEVSLPGDYQSTEAPLGTSVVEILPDVPNTGLSAVAQESDPVEGDQEADDCGVSASSVNTENSPVPVCPVITVQTPDDQSMPETTVTTVTVTVEPSQPLDAVGNSPQQDVDTMTEADYDAFSATLTGHDASSSIHSLIEAAVSQIAPSAHHVYIDCPGFGWFPVVS